jgi:hypothetical protein
MFRSCYVCKHMDIFLDHERLIISNTHWQSWDYYVWYTSDCVWYHVWYVVGYHIWAIMLHYSLLSWNNHIWYSLKAISATHETTLSDIQWKTHARNSRGKHTRYSWRNHIWYSLKTISTTNETTLTDIH